MGTFVRHIACENCGSSDGNAEYDDGTTYCFSCLSYGGSSVTNGDKVKDGKLLERHSGLLQGSYADLPKRGLREDTCRKYGYQVTTDSDGQPCHLANYRDAGNRVVAQKRRQQGKRFTWLGERSACLPLYGQHLWTPGKSVVITEGEIDCLSVAQAFGLKYAVVSLPDGAQSAPKAITKAYEWLCGFEKIVLCFDQDEPGQKAAQQVAEMLPVGKVFIMRLNRKDANDVLVHDGPAPITQAFWNAAEWRPDGIVSGSDLWDTLITSKEAECVGYPWPVVNMKTMGLRKGELVCITAGSGIGKSSFCREVAFHLLNIGETVGMMMLEESVTKTAFELMGLAVNRRLAVSRHGVSEETLRKAYTATVGCGRLYLYDHFGSTDIDNLLNRVRYMAKGLGCSWIILDHLSIVVSALEGTDERRMIDRAMTLLRTLVQETGIGLILVSHLKRPEGKGFENGAQTNLNSLRGSHAIAQLSDLVIGLERNQQPDKSEGDDKPKDEGPMTVRILKNRFTGETGETGTLIYDKLTGRLNESPI